MIEITETAIYDFIDTVTNNLEQLKANGLQVHLDDFGTGYSSLNHLIKIKVDAIKLDKSFIGVMLVKNEVYVLIKSIIELAHRLNMIVIAEGVEHIDQYNKLLELDCDKFQGYYFSRPESEQTIFDAVTKEMIKD